MTTPEQKTVNQLSINQAVMSTDLKNLTEDVTEIKSDIKEIKEILSQANELYVSKRFVKWLIGIAISISFLAITIYDHFNKTFK